MPGICASQAPSGTSPAAKASSPRPRAPPRAGWWSMGPSPKSGRVAEPTALRIDAGHLVDAEGDAGEQLLALLQPHGSGRDERRRARHRHQREGHPDRQPARGREDPRHRPRRLRAPTPRWGEPSRSRSTSIASFCAPRSRSTASRSCATASSWSEIRLCFWASRTSPRAVTRARVELITAQFSRGAELLDRHSDGTHNRTVLNLTATPKAARRGAGPRRGRLLGDDRHATS